eukprot:574852_1
MSAFFLRAALHIQLILSTEYANRQVSSFTLYPQDYIESYGGLARLILQIDGNLVMHKYSFTTDKWSFGDWGTSTNGDHVKLQDDGKLVVFDTAGGTIWQSNSTAGTSPFRLIVTDDVETYILDSLDKIVWSTNPSFASYEVIWTEPFNSNDMQWVLKGNNIEFPSTSSNCPNSDKCLEVASQNKNSLESWVVKYTEISMYNAIQLQVDITGDHDGFDYYYDTCEILYDTSGGWEFPYGEMALIYGNGVYKDVIIDFPLPDSYTSIGIKLYIYGDFASDKCYFDKAILRGIRKTTNSPTENTLSPTQPTNPPTKQPTELTQAPTPHPTPLTSVPTTPPLTSSPTKNPSEMPTEDTTNPTTHPSVSPTHNPSTAPIRQPSVSPTNAPSNHSISTQTSSVVTETINSAGNAIANDANTLSTMVVVVVILCILIVCVVVCIVGFVYRIRNNKSKRAEYDSQMVSEVHDVQEIEPQNAQHVIRYPPPAHPVPVALEICDDDRPYAVDRNGEGNLNINPSATLHDGDVYPLSHIAEDEFVIVGDDEDEDEEAFQRTGNPTLGSCKEDVDHVIEQGEKN